MNHEDTKTQREAIRDEVEDVARGIVDSAFRVHSQLGPGLVESINEVCVTHKLKAVEKIMPVHHAQVLTYLKLSGLRLGLLINFNVP